jgi:hypothetical protein
MARLNFALDLAAGRLPGVRPGPPLAAGTASGSDAVGSLAELLVPGGLSESTRRTLEREVATAPSARIAGLILGSPEFQRR